MISKHDLQETYVNIKHLTSDLKTKTYKTVLEISNESASENINLQKIDVNSTTFANVFIYGLLLTLIYIDQIRSMLFYNLENIGIDPIWTTFWMCLFSFSMYTLSKFVSIRRNKIIRSKLFGDSLAEEIQKKYVPEVNKDDSGDLVFYMLPIVLQSFFIGYCIVNSFSQAEKPLLFKLSIFSVLLLCTYFLIFKWAIFNAKKDYGPQFTTLRYYQDRNKLYVILLFASFILAVTVYYFLTHNNRFTGSLGVGVFDLLIVFLIGLRGLFAFIYYLYYKSPPLRELSNKSLQYSRIGNYILPLGPRTYFSCLLLTLLSIGFYIFPVNKCYNKIIDIKPIQLSQNDNEVKQRMSLEVYAKEWMLSRNNNNPIFLVAGQGGGSRAGFWTSSALANLHKASLQEDESFFYKNCFAISTVSGSSVGAALYLNTVHNFGKNASQILSKENLIDFFDRDYISSSILRLFFINPIQKLVSFPRWGRNDQLMHEEKDEYKSVFLDKNATLLKEDIRTYDAAFPVYYSVDEEPSQIESPLFLPNTYNVDKKKKSVISSVNLGKTYAHEDLLSIMLDEGNDSIQSREIVTIGTAVNLSQMFPIMSASARYDSCHYYDGGVYDNSGLSTIRDVYSVLSPLRDMYKKESQIIVIYLKNGSDSTTISDKPQSSIATLVKAASGSIFSANTNRHVQKFTKNALQLNDKLITDISHTGDITLNRWLSHSDCDSMIAELDSIFKKREIIEILKAEHNVRNILPKSHSYSVYFDHNDSILTKSDFTVIDRLFEGITPKTITLNGYADSSGKNGYNEQLSKSRAKAVKKYIMDKYDYDPSDIRAHGLGKFGDKTNESKQSNRRVDILFDFYKSKSGYFPAPFYVGN